MVPAAAVTTQTMLNTSTTPTASGMGSWFHRHQRKIAFHLVFAAAHLTLFVYGYYKQRNDHELRVLNRIGQSVYLSRAAGLVLCLDLCLVVGSMLRNCITFARTYLLPGWMGTWVNLDNHTYLHQWSAYAMLLFATIHVNCHYANFFAVQRNIPQLGLTAIAIHYTTFAGVTGHVMVVCAFLIYTTAAARVRKANFELFWYTHHLFVVFYVAAFLHAFGCFVKSADTGQCKSYLSRIYMAPLMLLYVLERVLREVRARRFTEVKRIILHPQGTVELQFIKPSMSYRAGQYVFLNVPQLSRWQWHPFTLSSAPEEPYISLHIKPLGDWTRALLRLVTQPAASGPGIDTTSSTKLPTHLPLMRIDGPYGAPAQDFEAYDSLLLISAGIGVTPSAALLKSIYYKTKRFRKVYFFWINRKAEPIEWFHSLLGSMEEAEHLRVELHLYLTSATRGQAAEVGTLMWLDGGGDGAKGHRDPVTALHARTHYGRPHWGNVLQRIRAEHEGEGGSRPVRIGVFCCGPAPLARQLEVATTAASSPTVHFHFKEELF